MRLLSGLLGLAGDVDPASLRRELDPVLLPDEAIEIAFAVLRDQIVFTDRRILFVDKQGATGRKRSYRSVPYRSVAMFSIETAGSFDADAELRIWISGQPEPTLQTLSRGANLPGIGKALAAGVMPR